MEFITQFKTIIIIIHAFAGAIGIGATTVTDTLFFKFLSDRVVTAGEKDIMDMLSKILWTALLVLIVSGVLIFASDTTRYLASSKFLVKVVIVGIIFLNGILLSTYLGPRLERLRFDTRQSVAQYPWFKRIAFASGVVSISSWYGAFLLGLVPSIPLSFVQGLLIYILILLIGGAISQVVLGRFSRIKD